MPFIDLDGLSLHYRREGRGTPLLLLAGLTSDAASWQPVWSGLAERFDLIAPDNRCTGRTLPNPVETSRDLMLADIEGLLDELEIERIAVLGHSMGAMLGWAFAARSPERVTALVAAAGQPDVPPVRIDFFRTLASLRHTSEPALWYRLLFHALFSPAFFADGQLVEAATIGALAHPHQQSAASLDVQSAALESFIASPDLTRLRCQVLAMTGELDMLTTPAMLQARHGDDPRVRLAIVPNAAHALHWEAPQAVIELVSTFLGSNGH